MEQEKVSELKSKVSDTLDSLSDLCGLLVSSPEMSSPVNEQLYYNSMSLYSQLTLYMLKLLSLKK